MLCSVIRDSQNMPAEPMAEPASRSGRAPTRGTSWALSPAISMMVPTMGR